MYPCSQGKDSLTQRKKLLSQKFKRKYSATLWKKKVLKDYVRIEKVVPFLKWCLWWQHSERLPWRKMWFFLVTVEINNGLVLNVDWIQYFKLSNHSVSAVSLSVLNPTREESFKRSNIILVRIKPDCKTEPPTNTFM